MSLLLCAYICGLQALHDLQFYLRYPGQVQHLQQRMTSIRFPAFSFCVEKGFNLSALCERFSHMDCEDNDGVGRCEYRAIQSSRVNLSRLDLIVVPMRDPITS